MCSPSKSAGTDAAGSASATGNSEEAEMAPEGQALLAKLKHRQRQAHLEGQTTGSVTATDRLMKELRDIYKSDNYKRGR
jgi:ubiquitin-conjugating enzyme E2 Q